MLIAVLFLLLPVQIFAQAAQFTFQPAGGNYCAPAQIKFIPQFSEVPLAYYWQTGNADEESLELSPNVTYNVPGTYKVTLVVLFSNSLREITQAITVHGPPALELKPNQNFLCQPGNVIFSLNANSGLKNTTWDFGDGITDTFPDGGVPVTHLYNTYGVFQVNVAAIDNWGCVGNSSMNYEVKRPFAELIDTPINGCLPVEVLFNAKITVPEGSSVTSYTWDFNDGTPPLINSSNEMRHTYVASGTYVANLSITTAEGCTNSFRFNEIGFASQLDTPKLSVNKTIGCASEIMYFTASGNSADKYHWLFDNGTLFSSMMEISTEDSVLAYEFNELGDFNLRVVAENNGCLSVVSEPVSVSIRGVVADFNFSNSCIEKNRFVFRNTSEGIVNKIQWTFIDNNNTSIQSRPVFIFPKEGKFPVTMIVTDNSSGCSDTASTLIYTAMPKLLPSDSFVCLRSDVNLGVYNTYHSPQTSYTWLVGGKSSSPLMDSFYTTGPSTAGEFINRVIINNGFGYCRDTLVQQKIMKVSGPSASFNSPAMVCQSDRVLTTNATTIAFEANPVAAWKWDFGNGVTSSDKIPMAVNYGSPGNFIISLEVEDIDGCKSAVSRKIKVNRPPLLRIVPRSQKVCQGKDFSLNALHKGDVKWSIAGTNGCDTCTIITINPMAPTRISATASDANGCASSDSVDFSLWYPFELAPGAIRDTSICTGNSVQMNLGVSGKLINWTPSTGLSSTVIANPVATPAVTTQYNVVVTDSGNCFTRTATSLIEVNPIPVVDPGPDLVLPYNTQFTIKPFFSPGIASYTWQPASLLKCANCPQPTGIATVSTLFTVNVVSDKGCKSSARIRLTLDCSDKNLLMPTAFTPNGDGLNDFFYPLTRGINIIRRFVIYNRLGELIYEKRDFKPNERSLGWNGMYKGKGQPNGSFVYFVEAECDLGNTLSSKGNIMLMR